VEINQGIHVNVFYFYGALIVVVLKQ